MKKTLSLILSAIMLITVISAVPFSALADTLDPASGSCGNAAYYSLDANGKLTITGSGTIDGGAFSNGYDDIKSVEIGNGITEIGSSAFSLCRNLESVTIGSGVKKIDYYAFSETGLTSVNIPSSVKEIEWDAFYKCTSMTSAVINGTSTIGDDVFNECFNLSAVTLGEGIKYIGDGAFRNCFSLSSITIPNSLTAIDNDAFEGCTMLSSVTFGTGLASIPYAMFEGFSNLTSVTIPEGVKKIERYSFANSGLKSINIPSSVNEIEWNAFSECSSLESATINGTTTIGGSVFYGCINLKSVTLKEGTKTIESGVFDGCSSLKSLTIPDSVTSLGYVFDDCFNVETLKVGSGVQELYDTSDMTSLKSIYVYGRNTVIPHESSIATGATIYCFYNSTAYNFAKEYGRRYVLLCNDRTTNHSYVNTAYVAPTFTTYGKTAGKYCDHCGAVITPQYSISKLGSPALTKLKKGKKSFTAQWSKANGVDGYQIQYSLKKNFKGAKTKWSKGNKLTVKKLKSKKTYYVRVRAYKNIGGKNVYSAWSTKKIKVK